MEQSHDPSNDDLRPRGNRPARGARVVTPGELVEGALRRGDENGDFLGLGGGPNGLMEMAQELASAEHHAPEEDAPMELGVLGQIEPAAHDPLQLAPAPAPDIYAGAAAADDGEGEWEGDLDAQEETLEEPEALEPTWAGTDGGVEADGVYAEVETDAAFETVETFDEGDGIEDEDGQAEDTFAQDADAYDADGRGELADGELEDGELEDGELEDGELEDDDVEHGELEDGELEPAVAEHEDDAYGVEQGAGYEHVLPFTPAKRRSRKLGVVAALGASALVVASLAVVLPETGLLPFEVPYEVPASVRTQVRGLVADARALLGRGDAPHGAERPAGSSTRIASAETQSEPSVATTPTEPASAPDSPLVADPEVDSLAAGEDEATAHVTAAQEVVDAAEAARERFAGLAADDAPEPAALAADEPPAPLADDVAAAIEPPEAPADPVVVGPAPVVVAPLPEATTASATSGRVRLEGQILARDQVVVPEIPGALRRATAEELQGRWPHAIVPPMESAKGETDLHTPLVGRVRLVTDKGDVFEGRLYAMGKGQVWIENDLGRMALSAATVAKIDRLPESPTTQNGKVTAVATGERVRVKTAGGLLYGRIVSRDGNRVTLLTDSGGRITLVDPVMEPADQKVPGGVLGGTRPATVDVK